MNTRRAAVMMSMGFALACGAGFAQINEASERAVRFMEQEYALARTSSTYFVFNMAKAAVSLKSRGILLKEWPAAKVRIWGEPGGVMTLSLVEKTAFREPRRKDITPGKKGPEKKAPAGGDDLDILELSRMPVNYSLKLSEDVWIKVRLRRKGIGRIVEGIGRFFSVGLGRSIKTIFRGAINKPFTVVEIVFTEENAAKNIYWSFFEGQKCILYWPE